jgi:hypothetical protein
MYKLSLIYRDANIAEKYKENFDVSSEGLSSGVTFLNPMNMKSSLLTGLHAIGVEVHMHKAHQGHLLTLNNAFALLYFMQTSDCAY